MSKSSCVHVFEGIPTFFRGCCRTSSYGEAGGYSLAGWHLMHNAPGLVPYTAEQDEWDAEIELVEALILADDRPAVLDWFVTRYPKCMALVPKRRREQFLKGVYQTVIG